jgi:hypothetical protein
MQIHIMPFDAIAQFVADELSRVITNKPSAVIGLTTGTTPLKTGLSVMKCMTLPAFICSCLAWSRRPLWRSFASDCGI